MGIQRTPARYFTAQEVKNYLIRGADRTDTITYPSREWDMPITVISKLHKPYDKLIFPLTGLLLWYIRLLMQTFNVQLPCF